MEDSPAMRKEGGRGRGRGETVLQEPGAARGPCPECGALLVAPPRQVAREGGEEARVERGGGQENYIKSLQQQIKILELEVAYLKRQGNGEGRVMEKHEVERPEKGDRSGAGAGNGEAVKIMQQELQVEKTRVEQLKIEKTKAGERLKQSEVWREEERSKAVGTQARLEGRVEELEREGGQREQRMAGLLGDLERQVYSKHHLV